MWDVIIAFAWIDARLAHSQKYTDNLRNIFPTSTIVLVMVTAGFYFSIEKSRENILSPVVGILHKEKDNVNISKGILLFDMSNCALSVAGDVSTKAVQVMASS
ncbi:hypothetical protein Ac2012v2_007888 [Leucoagaricus gongylophorus]